MEWAFSFSGILDTLGSMGETDWSKVLGWPGYRVYRNEINERPKTLKLWEGGRRRRCRSYRARRRSASASKRRWGWPVRARRYDEWHDSLAWPAARYEPSMCAI